MVFETILSTVPTLPRNLDSTWSALGTDKGIQEGDIVASGHRDISWARSSPMNPSKSSEIVKIPRMSLEALVNM
jgi:hypothetical protein